MLNEKQDFVAIISVGNQARTWALNLFDSNVPIRIGVRQNNHKVEQFQNEHPKLDIELITPEWISKQQIIALLIPDDQHLQFFIKYDKYIKPGAMIIYAHGFSEVAYKINLNYPQFFHALLAPKSIASEMRQNFLDKKTLAAVYALPQNSNLPIEEINRKENTLLQIAKGLGVNWGPFKVSFEQECKADLFSEQTLLCNLLPQLLAQGYNTMIKKNIPWQLAFCEIFLELKLIVNALENVGPEQFFSLISPNALIGSEYYRKEWENDLPFEMLFEKCWANLENDTMIQYLSQAKVEKIRDDVLNDWKSHPLTEAYKKFQSSKIAKE